MTNKQLAPFALVSVMTIAVLGQYCVRRHRLALTRDLEGKAEIEARNLAEAINDSFSMGEYDKMQELLLKARRADEDLDYAIVVGVDGRVVASTDPVLRNQMLNRNEFETSATKATQFTMRDLPDRSGFEVVTPTSFRGQQSGVLRIGVSMRRVHAAIRGMSSTVAAIGAIFLLIGLMAQALIIRRVLEASSLVPPLDRPAQAGDSSNQMAELRAENVGLRAQIEALKAELKARR